MSNDLSNVDLTKAPTPEESQKEEESQESKPEKEEEKTLADALSVFADAPNDELVESWKEQHGEVLCSGFTQTEIYVFRPLTRDEFVNLQAFVQQNQVSGYEVERKIVDTCLLWASPPGLKALKQKAGSLTTLHEQILQSSNFVNAAVAGQFVIKL